MEADPLTKVIQELENFDTPEALLSEIFQRFGSRAAIGTSGQLTGVVMIDMAIRSGCTPRIFTIDTLRLFPETYELFDRLEKRYGVVIEKIQPDATKVASMVQEHGEFLFFDSKEKQEMCCHLRKVEPNQQVLKTLDVWITGLRMDQSQARAKARENASRFETVPEGENKRQILKVSPLLRWTEEELRQYAKKYDVPTHALLNGEKDGWYYESLGCTICTTPIGPHEPRRAGRWRWFNSTNFGDKECGIHRTVKDEL